MDIDPRQIFLPHGMPGKLFGKFREGVNFENYGIPVPDMQAKHKCRTISDVRMLLRRDAIYGNCTGRDIR